MTSNLSDRYTVDVVGYVAGYIFHRINNILDCQECLDIIKNGTVDVDRNQLIKYKEWGNLKTPTKDIGAICIAGERAINAIIGDTPKKFNFELLVLQSFRYLDLNTFTSLEMVEHIKNQFVIDNHRYLAIKNILNMYFRVRFHFMCKNFNSKKIMLRKKLTKLIHFTEN